MGWDGWDGMDGMDGWDGWVGWMDGMDGWDGEHGMVSMGTDGLLMYGYPGRVRHDIALLLNNDNTTNETHNSRDPRYR
jgi:hypothetical protein